jgi:DNA-directed RNA polymerase subunit K/omega
VLQVSYGILFGMANADPSRVDAPSAAADAPVERTAPIESRFLFVDVAAQRAKQLRRGALPRLPGINLPPPGAPRPDYGHKLERLAMDEVKQGYITYTLPPTPGKRRGDGT